MTGSCPATDDRHHCQPSVSNFCVKFFLLDLRVSDGLPPQVAGNAQEAILIVGGLLTKQPGAKLAWWVCRHLVHEPQVANAAKYGVLEPAHGRDLCGCGQAIGNVREFDFAGR